MTVDVLPYSAITCGFPLALLAGLTANELDDDSKGVNSHIAKFLNGLGNGYFPALRYLRRNGLGQHAAKGRRLITCCKSCTR